MPSGGDTITSARMRFSVACGASAPSSRLANWVYSTCCVVGARTSLAIGAVGGRSAGAEAAGSGLAR